MIEPGYVKTLVDNAEQGIGPKVQIRQHVLRAITPERAIVFDAFAGAGRMFAEVWKDAAGYVGCDESWHDDPRCCFVADNRRVLRAIDLAPFTVFDLDSYGSPWEQALIIAARRPALARGDRVGLVITDGCWTTSRLVAANTGPRMLRLAAGITLDLAKSKRMSTIRLYDDSLDRALRNVARQMSGRIVQQWRAASALRANMRYLGVVVEGV